MSVDAHLSAKRRNDNMVRRMETLFIKGHELWDDYGIDIAIILKNNTRYCTYRSTNSPIWPPSMSEIVSILLPVCYGTNFNIGEYIPYS
jgi:hypothetical protein